MSAAKFEVVFFLRMGGRSEGLLPSYCCCFLLLLLLLLLLLWTAETTIPTYNNICIIFQIRYGTVPVETCFYYSLDITSVSVSMRTTDTRLGLVTTTANFYVRKWRRSRSRGVRAGQGRRRSISFCRPSFKQNARREDRSISPLPSSSSIGGSLKIKRKGDGDRLRLERLGLRTCTRT